MEVAREVGSRWRASQLRVPGKIIGVRLIACSCSTCKQTDMVSLSTFIPMFDEMGTNMTGSSCSRQPLGLWAGFMLLHNHSVFSVFLLGYLHWSFMFYYYVISLSLPTSNGKDPVCGWFCHHPPLSFCPACIRSGEGNHNCVKRCCICCMCNIVIYQLIYKGSVWIPES